MLVKWKMEWNGIVQACYIQYSTDDRIYDALNFGATGKKEIMLLLQLEALALELAAADPPPAAAAALELELAAVLSLCLWPPSSL
jgi:hypothetical protein